MTAVQYGTAAAADFVCQFNNIAALTLPEDFFQPAYLEALTGNQILQHTAGTH